MLANSPSSNVALLRPFDPNAPKPLHAATERYSATTLGDVTVFGDFRLVPSSRSLTKGGTLIPLGARALEAGNFTLSFCSGLDTCPA
jgi:hypothetical protein